MVSPIPQLLDSQNPSFYGLTGGSIFFLSLSSTSYVSFDSFFFQFLVAIPSFLIFLYRYPSLSPRDFAASDTFL